MNPKISIIVPVYKVEPYIHKCVDSILAQTFSDFELILVDDGSPDNCGSICDAYAEKDKRVKVIHKNNEGISTARNAGLDLAKGDYIGFVDSDDWIESDMYELLYNMCISNDCEIASCTSKIYYSDKTVITGTHSLKILDKSEAMRVVIEGSLYDEVVWTKLFKRSLLDGVRFPVGRVYEDTAFTYRVIHRSQRVCCIGEPKYNYVKRNGSTMDSATKNMRIDAILIYEEMFEFISEFYPIFCDLVILKLANNAMRVLNLISESPSFHNYKTEYYTVSGILNKHFSRIVKLKNYPITVKLLLTANKVNPLLYKLLINCIRKRR
jgi:glycosyltransferase involved in cell wall biosynthesis